jgi:hypothetical protein
MLATVQPYEQLKHKRHPNRTGFARTAMFMTKTAHALFSAMLLCGCGPTSEEYSSPEIVLNQSPKSTYLLDVKFDDAPGPFTEIRSRAFYEVTEPGCVRPLWGSGAVVRPHQSLLLQLKKVADDHYQAEFHLDAIRAEDYFGFGVCKWSFPIIGLEFSSPATNFTTSLSNFEGAPKTIGPTEHFFLSRDYFKKPDVGNLVFGEMADFYLPKWGSQFLVTLSAEKLGS